MTSTSSTFPDYQQIVIDLINNELPDNNYFQNPAVKKCLGKYFKKEFSLNLDSFADVLVKNPKLLKGIYHKICNSSYYLLDHAANADNLESVEFLLEKWGDHVHENAFVLYAGPQVREKYKHLKIKPNSVDLNSIVERKDLEAAKMITDFSLVFFGNFRDIKNPDFVQQEILEIFYRLHLEKEIEEISKKVSKDTMKKIAEKMIQKICE